MNTLLTSNQVFCVILVNEHVVKKKKKRTKKSKENSMQKTKNKTNSKNTLEEIKKNI